MFERARASEFVSASARRLLTEGTGAHAPAQPVDPPHGYRPGRRVSDQAKPHGYRPGRRSRKRSTPDSSSGAQKSGIWASPAYI